MNFPSLPGLPPSPGGNGMSEQEQKMVKMVRQLSDILLCLRNYADQVIYGRFKPAWSHVRLRPSWPAEWVSSLEVFLASSSPV